MSRKPLVLAAASAALFTLALTACKSGSDSVTLSGAGSSFVYPVMTRWIEGYHQAHPNTQINYQSVGSGAGVQQVKANTVDFGASDAAQNDEQLKGLPPVLQIPETAGPVCLTYNLPELKAPLQLTGTALAGLFLGTIKTWNDPEIAKANPGVSLPATKVAVVHRVDGSGTTNIFTTYLSAVSPDWKSKVGAANSVNWPVGLGGKGSEGVTGQLRNQPGAIGYVELTYAQQNKLPIANIQNLAGKYISPSSAATTAAIDAFKDQLTTDPRLPIVNPPATATEAYPIAGLTFLIIPKDGPDKARRAELKSFVQYIIGDGQQIAGSLNYAPLPTGIQQYDQQQLTQMLAAGQPIN